MSKYDLRFDLIDSPRQIRQLEAFMLAQVGPYDAERHQAWVEDVCMPAVAADERRALAWWSHGTMIGEAVLKPLIPDEVELKNFRIAPGQEGRYLGSVMMAHIELEGRDLLLEKGLLSSGANNFTVQLDTSAQLESYFARHGFETVDRAELYTPGKQESIMQRTVPLH
jgi:N-acetylglutamate synthase-like GNAT family acetyltransferase